MTCMEEMSLELVSILKLSHLKKKKEKQVNNVSHQTKIPFNDEVCVEHNSRAGSTSHLQKRELSLLVVTENRFYGRDWLALT